MRRIETLVRRIAASGALGLAAIGVSGCCYYELRDACDECSFNLRHGFAARAAWHRCSMNYVGHAHSKAFKDGFIDGYVAVCDGADGCPPAMPPRSYWSCCNSGREGQAAVNAYFDGYARGAVAAEADGMAASSRIPYRRSACGGAIATQGYGPGPAALVPAPSHSMPSETRPPARTVDPPESLPLPPPAPPSSVPSAPAVDAYDGYDGGGLYYE